MNKIIRSILLGSLIGHGSAAMAMNGPPDEKSQNVSDNLPYACPINFYTNAALSRLVQEVDLHDAAERQVSRVTLPLVENPFADGLMASATASIEEIDEEGSTLEKNGFEVLDFSDDRQFVALLKEFYDLDYVKTSKEEQDQLKRRFSQLLKVKLDQWLAAKKSQSFRDAQWTAIRATDVAVRTTGPKLEGDKRQTALPLLHADYPDALEFRRYANLRDEDDKVNEEPQANVVSYINIWAPTDESVGGTPLALMDIATMKSDDLQDVVIVPIIDGVLKPDSKFIGRGIEFDAGRHKLYSVARWTRGKIVVFHTFTTPHTAALVKPGIPRNSVEIRGFISGTKVE